VDEDKEDDAGSSATIDAAEAEKDDDGGRVGCNEPYRAPHADRSIARCF